MKKKWTIYDAKDGDILVTNEQIFMFKEIGNRDYVDNCIEYHCRVYNDEFNMADGGYMGTVENEMRKATKKEKEKLFALMNIAGYKCDIENKKVVKLADYEGLTEFEHTLIGIVNSYNGKKMHKEGAQAWSKELLPIVRKQIADETIKWVKTHTFKFTSDEELNMYIELLEKKIKGD